MSEDLNRATERLSEALDTLLESRKSSINSYLNLSSLKNVAIHDEASRLEKIYGPDDPRTVAMKSRLEMNHMTLSALEVRSGLEDIHTEKKVEGEVLVEGWVGDAKGRGAAGLGVRLVNAKEEPVTAVGAVTVRAGGYFAFKIPAEIAAKIADANPQGVSIVVVDAKKTVVGSSSTRVVLTGKEIPLQQIVLKSAPRTRGGGSTDAPRTGFGKSDPAATRTKRAPGSPKPPPRKKPS